MDRHGTQGPSAYLMVLEGHLRKAGRGRDGRGQEKCGKPVDGGQPAGTALRHFLPGMTSIPGGGSLEYLLLPVPHRVCTQVLPSDRPFLHLHKNTCLPGSFRLPAALLSIALWIPGPALCLRPAPSTSTAPQPVEPQVQSRLSSSFVG